MLDLYLIRHAESQMNIDYEKFIGGRSNHTPLSSKGELQAKALGEFLTREGVAFDEVYASPAVRALRTAEIALKEMGIEGCISCDDLQEQSQGEWEGADRKSIYTPEWTEYLNRNNWVAKAPGGESQKDVEERMHRWVDRTLLGRDVTAGAFTHGMAIKCFLRKVLDSRPALTYKIAIDNTSFTRLRHDARGWHLLTVNSTPHYLLL